MADLIDREELISDMKDTKAIVMNMFQFPKNQINVAEAVADAMLYNARNAPAVDAMPVVRCINCKNACLDKFACLHCLMYCRPVEDDFYCADYERMDGGKNA